VTKRRVVVLGGGCGGVAAAWALSRTPELRNRFDVTVVQPGFRLGGKGATGRDETRGQAVLEHGLHLWLGFYKHAFGMIKEIYDAWDRPSRGPQRSLEAAFSPLANVAFVGGSEQRPEVWRMRFPDVRGRPWDAAGDSPSAWADLAATWARRLPEALVSVEGDGLTRERLKTLAALAAAIARGLASELGRHGSAAWDQMDALDLREWLMLHGASREESEAPPIGALYDLGFAYPDGRPGPGRGSAAAGVALKILLKIFGGYRGAPFWRMNAGMGDTVFAPAYEVLTRRGVRFRFFHRVERLRLRGLRVAAIELAVQARDPDRYEPLIAVGPIRAWPDRPVASRLEAMAAGDLEADTGAELGRRTLVEGDHFDEVVLAIPSTAHRHFASELIARSPRYRKMVENTHGVATIAAEWWLSRKTSQLGWQGEPPVLTGLSGLFRTWADLSELADAEAWAERPLSIGYFCNVAPPEVAGMTDRAEAAQWVRQRMAAWAAGPLRLAWPESGVASGGFDEGALTDASWQTQYARANVADWERYVLSLPGTTAFRLAPDESGFDNLVLAGDWTRNVVNGGSVEGAVSSGIDAAAAIIARA
jgi:uncharacterized protein with NAD-binding domain and iron-sulfur cluster